MLERKDIEFNIQNSTGETGFIWACINQPNLIIPLLESNKIDITLKNNQGLTGWDIAKEYNFESFKLYKSYIENQKLSNNITTKFFKPKPLL